MEILYCADNWGQNNARILRAKKTIDILCTDFSWKRLDISDCRRETTSGRGYPYLKDWLLTALSSTNEEFMLVMGNADSIIMPKVNHILHTEFKNCSICLGQRVEINNWEEIDKVELQSGHEGRDLVIFNSNWLKRNLCDIPDFLLGVCAFDLCFEAWANKEVGTKWQLGIAGQRNPKCDLPLGCVFHERHESNWTGMKKLNDQNVELARNWFKANLPESNPY